MEQVLGGLKVVSSSEYNPFNPPGAASSRLIQFVPNLPGQVPPSIAPAPAKAAGDSPAEGAAGPDASAQTLAEAVATEPVTAEPATVPEPTTTQPPIVSSGMSLAPPVAVPVTPPAGWVASQGAARIVPPAAGPNQMRSFG